MITDDSMITDDYRWLQKRLQFFPSPEDLDPIRSVPDPQSHDGWHVVFHIGMLPAARDFSKNRPEMFRCHDDQANCACMIGVK